MVLAFLWFQGRSAAGCEAPHVQSRIAPLSPVASLISRAVRIRAISVDVKWTVRSSGEMGMFIRTRRCGEEGRHCERWSGFLPPPTLALPSCEPPEAAPQLPHCCPEPFVR